MKDRNLRYSKIVADHFGAELFDFSEIGSSNELIAQKTINNILELEYGKKLDLSKALVLVQWSFLARLNYFLAKQKKYYTVVERYGNYGSKIGTISGNFELPMIPQLSPYYTDHSLDEYLYYNFARNIHHTQSFLKSKNLNYFFLFGGDDEIDVLGLSPEDLAALNVYPDEKYKKIYDSGNTPKVIPYYYYSLKTIDKRRLYLRGITNYCLLNNFPRGVRGHPLEETHTGFAKLLIPFIEKHYEQK